MPLEINSNTTANSNPTPYTDPNIRTKKGDGGQVNYAASSKAMSAATLGQTSAEQLREISGKANATTALPTPNVNGSEDPPTVLGELTEKVGEVVVTLQNLLEPGSELTADTTNNMVGIKQPSQKPEVDHQSGGEAKTLQSDNSENNRNSNSRAAGTESGTPIGNNEPPPAKEEPKAEALMPDGTVINLFDNPKVANIVTQMSPIDIRNSMSVMERAVALFVAVAETQNETQRNLQLSSLRSVISAYKQKLEAAGERFEAAKDTAEGMKISGIDKIIGGSVSGLTSLIGMGAGSGIAGIVGSISTGVNAIAGGCAELQKAGYDLEAAAHTFAADNLSASADYTSTIGQNAASSAANTQRALQKMLECISSFLNAVNQTTTTIAQNIRS